MSPNESPNDLIGRTVGAYRVIERIGAGGMGEVYKAHDTKLDRPVALKLLPTASASQTDRLRRFHIEARTASSLNHPYIVVIHDIGDLNGRPLIVSEFVEGETLRKRLNRGPLPLDDALHIVLQLTSALAAAHARGIVHRDIKPENVMVRPDGYIKVLDFGLAKLMPSVAGSIATQTEPGVILGTPHYMSPEQVRGLETDPRTDVWSIGAVLYELLAGCPPFEGSSFADILTAILHRDPVSLTIRASHVPETVAVIVSVALAKDPSLRYASAVELHSDLTNARDGPGRRKHVMSGGGSPIRVLTVDDHPVVREGIAGLVGVQPDMTVVAEAVNGRDAIPQFRAHRPDVTLMDIQMPEMNGLDALIAIRTEFPNARVIMLTTYEGDVHILRAMKSGAQGYLLKNTLHSELLQTIRAVHAGKRSLSPEVSFQVAQHVSDQALTPAEVVVLRLIAAGNANKQIADQLAITEDTVKGRVKSILAKLEANDRTHAAIIGLKRGIIEL